MFNSEVPSLLATLLERIQGREALDLEFKAARGGLPKEVWPTVSAFANTQGGWLLLGVGERDGRFHLDGVARAAGLVTNFYDLLRNVQKISNCVCGPGDVSTEQVDGKEVVVIRIPAAARKSRPVYINGNPYSGTYVRRNSADYRCTKPEVDRMMREASDAGADSTVLKNFSLEDIDRDALARYRRRYQTLNPGSPWNGYDDDAFLRTIGGIKWDREAGLQGVTVAALLMLGTPEALREWRGRHMIDYRRVPSDSIDDTRWLDRVVWEGNLLGAFETIYPRLVEGQPVPFRMEEATRVSESPVHVALREALVNLLIHADYADAFPSLIKRFDEGTLFRNPGSSRVSEIDLRTGDRSDPRNPQLAFMFRQIGLAEEAGTGIPKILKTWRELGFHLPEIHTDTERYEFTLDLRHVHLRSDEDREWLLALGEGWTETEQIALLTARQDGEVDNLTVRTLTGQHPFDVTRVLGSLRDRGFLRMVGAKRGARYELGPAVTVLPGARDISDQERDRGRAESLPLLEGSGPEERSSTNDEQSVSSDTLERGPDNLPIDSANLAASSTNCERSPTTSELDVECPPDIEVNLWLELLELSRLARERKYLDAATRDSIIVAVCARHPMSILNLARLTKRSTGLIRHALTGLVSTSNVSLFYPRQPSHPKQRYVAKGTRIDENHD